MDEVLIAIIAFAAGYLCGLITKHEIWQVVLKHGSKTGKEK